MAEQFSLFDAPQPATHSRAPADIGPAETAPAVAALGRQLPQGVYLGTSSWAFPGWAGIVYDRAGAESALSRRGLAAYSRHPVLRAVGIDRTFYTPIGARDFAAYAEQVPAGFRFLVKAPAAVTDAVIRSERGRAAGDNPRFLDAALALDSFVRPALDGLGDKAGPLVFQFSPLGRGAASEPARFVARLHGFLDALRRSLGGATALLAVEVRDPEILGDGLAAALDDVRARFCFGVHSRMPSVAAQAAAMAACAPGPLVARWNLHSGFGYEEAKAQYAPFDRIVDEDPETRGALAALAADAIGRGDPAFVIANNKAEGSAPLTVIELARAIVAARGQGGRT
ncbi:MAG: DUF72 domain-containing protein [Burkholderiales bacterium]|jgi:uncharacterized protein YecE (DUF72 family)|nr:DUF72 domain-containing protein [Burkholderiales bacterium]